METIEPDENKHDFDLSIVTEKGTVCIPAEKRKKLNIQPGMKVYWRENEKGEMVLGKQSDYIKNYSGNNGGNTE